MAQVACGAATMPTLSKTLSLTGTLALTGKTSPKRADKQTMLRVSKYDALGLEYAAPILKHSEEFTEPDL